MLNRKVHNERSTREGVWSRAEGALWGFCVSVVGFRIKRSARSFSAQTLGVRSSSASPAAEPGPMCAKKGAALEGLEIWKGAQLLVLGVWKGLGWPWGLLKRGRCAPAPQNPWVGSAPRPAAAMLSPGECRIVGSVLSTPSMAGSWNGPLATRENCLCSFQQMEQIFYKAILHRKSICVSR